MILRDDFSEDVATLRNKYPGAISPILTSKPGEFKLFPGVSVEEFQRDIRSLLSKFELHDGWFDFIKKYIIENDFLPQDDYDPDGVILEINNPEDGSHGANILLHQYLTLEDIKRAWPLIKTEAGVVLAKKRKGRRSEFERDYEIYKMKESGKTIRQIGGEFSKRGVDLEHWVIINAISKMKKALRIKKKIDKLRT